MNKLGIQQRHITPLMRDRGWSRERDKSTGKYILINRRYACHSRVTARHPKVSYLGKGLFESWNPWKCQTDIHSILPKALEASLFDFDALSSDSGMPNEYEHNDPTNPRVSLELDQ